MSKRDLWTMTLLGLACLFLFADQNLLAPNLTAIAEEFGFDDLERDVKLGGDIALIFWMLGGVVAMASCARLRNDDYIALFHDDGRFLRGAGVTTKFQVFKTLSKDGGLTWSEPVVIAEHPTAYLCEPGLVRSPVRGMSLSPFPPAITNARVSFISVSRFIALGRFQLIIGRHRMGIQF